MNKYKNFIGYVEKQDDYSRLVPCIVECMQNGVNVKTSTYAECGMSAIEKVSKNPDSYHWTSN
jgi:hypothetical protein